MCQSNFKTLLKDKSTPLSFSITLECNYFLYFITDILAYHAIGSTEYSKGLYNRERLTTLDREGDHVLISASSSEYYVSVSTWLENV